MPDTRTTTRPARLHAALAALEERGLARLLYCYSPGDRGRVWVVVGTAVGAMRYELALDDPNPMHCERAYSTREAEALVRFCGIEL